MSAADVITHRPLDTGDCRCVHTCAEDPATACSHSGEWHVHPDPYPGADLYGPCPVHPDAPGDV